MMAFTKSHFTSKRRTEFIDLSGGRLDGQCVLFSFYLSLTATGTLAALTWEGKWWREDQVVEHRNLHL